MTIRHLCAGLVLLATIGSAGCTCCGRNRTTACPAPAVAALPAAPPCCGEPGAVAPAGPVEVIASAAKHKHRRKA